MIFWVCPKQSTAPSCIRPFVKVSCIKVCIQIIEIKIDLTWCMSSINTNNYITLSAFRNESFDWENQGRRGRNVVFEVILKMLESPKFCFSVNRASTDEDGRPRTIHPSKRLCGERSKFLAPTFRIILRWTSGRIFDDGPSASWTDSDDGPLKILKCGRRRNCDRTDGRSLSVESWCELDRRKN